MTNVSVGIDSLSTSESSAPSKYKTFAGNDFRLEIPGLYPKSNAATCDAASCKRLNTFHDASTCV